MLNKEKKKTSRKRKYSVVFFFSYVDDWDIQIESIVPQAKHSTVKCSTQLLRELSSFFQVSVLFQREMHTKILIFIIFFVLKEKNVATSSFFNLREQRFTRRNKTKKKSKKKIFYNKNSKVAKTTWNFNNIFIRKKNKKFMIMMMKKKKTEIKRRAHR